MRRWRDLSPVEQIQRRIAYEEDVKILLGSGALVTGRPGPHARARQAAVGAENRLAASIAAFEEGRCPATAHAA